MHVTIAGNIYNSYLFPLTQRMCMDCGFQSWGGMRPSSIYGLMHLRIIQILAAAFIQVQHL